MGYQMILKVSEAESAMRESRTRKTKTVCAGCNSSRVTASFASVRW
jgi:predicted molibdopterin-dependent oxidoreductase YjgC